MTGIESFFGVVGLAVCLFLPLYGLYSLVVTIAIQGERIKALENKDRGNND